MQELLHESGHWTLAHLNARSQFRTDSANECRRYIQAKMRGHELNCSARSSALRFAHSEVQLGNVAIDLVHLDCGEDFLIRKERVDDLYVVQVPIAGVCEVYVGRRAFTLQAGQAMIVNPGQLLRKHWSGRLLQVMLRIDRATLQRVLSEDLQSELPSPLEFDGAPLCGGISVELPRILESIWRDFHSDRLLQHPRIVTQLERTLLLTVLGGAQHNFREQFDRVAEVAPCYVKRAEEFIQKNACGAVTIADLVTAAGVSARSLYSGFRRWRNNTPMSYLRRVRLDLARRELQRIAREGGKITQAAGNCGYEHLSRFSRDYRARFGENPSETLRKMRIS
jgi:AraC-like DNA-binding protein